MRRFGRWLTVAAAFGALAACAGGVASSGAPADAAASAEDANAAGADAVADAATVDAAADAQVEVADDALETASDVAPDVPLSLHGAWADPALDAPTFTKVVDSGGAKVSPDALQGHWTVLWFYPAASTAG